MRFHFDVKPTSDAADAVLSSQLAQELAVLDFDSPKQMMDTITDTLKAHAPHMRVGQHNGITNVHGRAGIVMRVRSMC